MIIFRLILIEINEALVEVQGLNVGVVYSTPCVSTDFYAEAKIAQSGVSLLIWPKHTIIIIGIFFSFS